MSLIFTFVSWLSTVSVLCVTAFWLYRKYVYRHFPPGPRGWPLVGNLAQLGPRPQETLATLAKQYGSVFGLTLGMEKVVILGDWKAIEEALVNQGEVFSGRPDIFAFDSVIKKRDVVSTHGPMNKIQRKFMVNTLRKMGSGSETFENTLMHGTDDLLETLAKHDSRSLNLGEHFFKVILNIIWRIAASHDNTGDDDEFVRSFFTVVKKNFEGFRGDNVLNFFPSLRHVAPGGFGYHTFLDNFHKLWDYLVSELDAHRATYVEGECRDIIDCHIEEMLRQKQLSANKREAPPFNTDHTIGSIYDIFLGGTDTNTNSLLWGILFLILHPRIQDKIHAELDSVVGRDRRPALSDKPNLTYLEAFFMELQRFATVAPLSLLHSPIRDANLFGYRIPKGTKVIENIYAVHRDPKLWGDPDVFRPERFIDADTNAIKKVPYLIPFSIGRRVCPGEQLARNTLYFVFSNMLQKFSFSIPPNAPRPSTVPVVTLTSNPAPFPVLITERK